MPPLRALQPLDERVDAGVDGAMDRVEPWRELVGAFAAEEDVLGLQRYTTAAHEARAQFLGAAAAEHEVELTVQFCGRYSDTFTHRDGQWRIEVRRSVYESVDGAEARGPLPTERDGLVAARRDAHDLLWSARVEAGIESH